MSIRTGHLTVSGAGGRRFRTVILLLSTVILLYFITVGSLYGNLLMLWIARVSLYTDHISDRAASPQQLPALLDSFARPESVPAWARARALSLQGDSEAETAYAEAYRLAPSNPVIALEFGNLYAALGDMDRAMQFWQAAESGRFWIMQALQQSANGQHALAVEYTERAQRLAPLDLTVQLAAGDIFLQFGEYKNAELAYSVVIDTGAEQSNDQRLARYRALTGRGRARAAQESDFHLSAQDLHAAHALQPNNTWSNIRLCELYRDADMLDDALQHCMTAVALAPNSAFAHYYLGRVYYERQERVLAIHEFERALELDPNLTSAERWRERASQP